MVQESLREKLILAIIKIPSVPNNMTELPSPNLFLILGIIFMMIAVLGQTKLGFAEINPGCFGRILALFLGIFSLILATVLVGSPTETLDLLKTYITQQVQQIVTLLSGLLPTS